MLLNVTEVEVELPLFTGSPRFLAYAKIVLEGRLVIRHIRLVRLPSGRIYVQMPTRKRTRLCPDCAAVLPNDHRYCGCCGVELPFLADPGKPVIDVAFALDNEQRAAIDGAVLRAYADKLDERARLEAEATAEALALMASRPMRIGA